MTTTKNADWWSQFGFWGAIFWPLMLWLSIGALVFYLFLFSIARSDRLLANEFSDEED